MKGAIIVCFFFLKSLEKDINPIMLKNTKIQLHGES